MKIYVHHEGEPEFTKVFRIDNPKATTVEGVLGLFLSAYQQKHGIDLPQRGSLRVRDENQKQLQLDAKVAKVLQDHADVFVEVDMAASTAAAAPTSLPAATATTTAPQTPPQQPAQPSQAPPLTLAPNVVSSSSNNKIKNNDPAVCDEPDPQATAQAASVLRMCMERAEAAAKNKNYRLAGDIYNQVLGVAPGLEPVLEQAARMWLEGAKHPLRALPYARKLAEAAPEDVEAQELLGLACL